MASLLESIQQGIGTVSDIVTKSADTYDRAMASFNPSDDPYWYEGQKASEPAKSVGVEVAQAQPASSSGLLILAVIAVVLLKVL
jgi:hypothetical protein